MFDDFDPLSRTSTVNGENAEMTSTTMTSNRERDHHHHRQQQQQQQQLDDQFADLLGEFECNTTDDANGVSGTSTVSSSKYLGDSDLVEYKVEGHQVATETNFDEV